MLDRNALLAMVVGVCIVNGIFSPFIVIALQITPVLMPEVFPKSVEWVLFFSSIFVASGTLLFSGVPAALYERLTGADPDSTVSMWIWLSAAVLLTLPALRTLQAI